MKKWLLNKLLRHLFPIVDIEQVLTTNKQKKLYLNGELIEAKKLGELEQEVMLIRNSALWGILQNTLKHQAQVIMFEKSKTMDDLLASKAMLYTLDVQNKIIKMIEKR